MDRRRTARWCAALMSLAAFQTAGCSDRSAASKPAPSETAKTTVAKAGVVVLRYQTGSESTEQRESGFLDTLRKEFPDILVLSEDLYSGATREGALAKAENLLTRFGSKIDGWFCPCEPVTHGTLQALRNKGLSGKVKVVGFDSGDKIVAALASDEIHGLVLQDPVNMGYLGVKAAVDQLDGKSVEKRRSTGENLITPENLNEPRSKELHSPDLEKWLAGGSAAPVDSSKKKYTIAVVPKGTLHDFWKSIHAGAVKAERELGNVEIVWKGPAREDDRQQQIQVVENFISRGVNAIVLAPLDKKALVPYVEKAMDKGIPVVIIDSGLDTDKIVSYISTDNYQGGVLAARHLAKLVSKAN